MKKLLFLLVLYYLLIGLSISNGQTFNAGLLAGLSTSQVSGDGYGGFNKVGVNLGAFTNTKMGNDYMLQFELQYIQKGSRKNPDTLNPDRLILRLDYVEIPLVLKYFHKNFYLEGGLYAAVLVNFYFEDENGEQTDMFDDVQLKKVKTSDFGGLIGLGYQINRNFSFNTRYSQSIGNVKEYESGAARWLDSGWRNSVIDFTFRYTFGQNG